MGEAVNISFLQKARRVNTVRASFVPTSEALKYAPMTQNNAIVHPMMKRTPISFNQAEYTSRARRHSKKIFYETALI